MLVNAVRYEYGRRTTQGALVDVVDVDSREGFVWAGVHDPQPDEIAHVAEIFGLHPLAVEDAIKARQRPKVERYGEWLFIVMRTARYLDEPEEIDFGEIQIFVGPHAVVVIRRGEPVPLAATRERLESTPDRLAGGPVAVVHAVIDEVVDAYQLCLTGLDDDVNEVELDVFRHGNRADDARLIERMYFLQREILELHRALHPLVEGITVLREDPFVIDAPEWPSYFRDVADHLHRQQDQLAVLRDLMSAALNANATQISLRQNEDMRRISAWVAIVAVPTMIAGIYGMNFDHMPELEWTFGYPMALAVMAIACSLLYRLFRRSRWL